MSFQIRNILRQSVAAAALGMAATLLLGSTEAPAFGLGGIGGFGHFSMGRNRPVTSPSMNLGSVHTLGTGHMSEPSGVGRLNHGEGTLLSGNRNVDHRPGSSRTLDHPETAAKDRSNNADVRTARSDLNERGRNRDDDGRRGHNGLDIVVVPGVNGPHVFVPSYSDGGYTPVRPGLQGQTIGNPCKDKVLMVETTKAECINNIVTITGKKYYYCKTTKQTEEAPYSYPAIPKQECNAETVLSGEWLPEGWTKPVYEERGRCKDTGHTLIQYSPEGGKWMKITWRVFLCKNGETGKETERLDQPERASTGVAASDPAPVQPGDSVVGQNN
jgi:hypothetical protein